MIKSPGQSIESLDVFGAKPKFPIDDDKRADLELEKKAHQVARGNALVCYFLRMSWTNKLKLLTGFIERIRSSTTITILLNTLHSVTGKIASYCLSSSRPPIDYDKVVNDHDRMLEENSLQEVTEQDLKWFETLDSKDQLAYLITLLRYSGGTLMRLFYGRLRTVQAQKSEELRGSKTTFIPLVDSKEEQEHFEHNPDDPKHQKVLELEKNFNALFKKFESEIEKQKNKGKAKKKKKKSKKDKKKKSSKKTSKKKKKKKKGKEKKNQPLDWVQLMPIWIVKKIFNYLDIKTLKKAQKVNKYWKWAIGELLKDRKVLKKKEVLAKKLQVHIDSPISLTTNDAILNPVKPRVSFAAKRHRKLEERGAILEKLRLTSREVSNPPAIVVEALKFSMVPYSNNISMFPRVARTAPPLCHKPSYIVKDLELICENVDSSDSGEDLSTQVSSSESESSQN